MFTYRGALFMSLIAVVEDEQDILEVITYNLEKEGFDVMSSSRGDAALSLIKEKKPDLVVLDIMLPGMDGLEICKELRKDDGFQLMPIIMLTAKTEESDTVLGLGLGANDYVAKPFSPKELIARVKANLRTVKNVASEDSSSVEKVSLHGLTIDRNSHKVIVENDEVKLTASEFRLLFTLAKKPGRVFSREQLLENILTDHAVVVDRNVDVHIRAVRKKLGEHAALIETVRGVGYRFKE